VQATAVGSAKSVYGDLVSMLLALMSLAAAPDAGVLLSRPVQVSADKLELVNKEQRAVYSGHAKAIRDTTTLTCERITVEYGADREVSRILARGDVEAVDGERWARGDEADYDNRTGTLVMRGKPQARQGKREVVGELVTFVTGTERTVVEKARTRVDDEKGFSRDGGVTSGPQRITIDADQLVLDEQKNLAVWKGHVIAKRSATTITAPEMTAVYDEQGNISKVQARGGVEATEKDRWAKGQRGDYDVPTGVLVVTGQPHAKQGTNRMRGSKVTFLSGSDFIEVENAITLFEVESKSKRPPNRK
jgi:lipopolysaccharide transport protein LptA